MEKPITKSELEAMLQPALKRIDYLEGRDKQRSEEYNSLQQAQAKLDGKIEMGLQAVKEQIKSHGERYDSAVKEVKDLVSNGQTSLQKLIESSTRETNDAIRTITQTLGIDGHSDNAFHLKTDLKHIRDQRLASEKTFELIKSNVIGLIAKAVAVVMFAGLCMVIGQRISGG